MKRKFLMGAAFVLLAMLSLAAAFDGKKSEDQSTWQRDLLAWRAQRTTALQAPEGWLSLIALGWLKEGDNSFGSAEDSRVQIAGKAPAHIAVVRLEKGALRLLPPAGGFPEGPSRRWSAREGAGSRSGRCRQAFEAYHRDAHHHRDPSRRPVRAARQGPASSHSRGLPRIALVCAECRLPHTRALDPVQPSQSARYSDRPRDHDPYASPGRCRIYFGWASPSTRARARRSEINRSFLYSSRRHQQNYDLWSGTLSIYRTSRPWRKPARRSLARFQSAGEPALCVYPVCDVSVASAAESPQRAHTGRRAALP